MSPIAVYRAHKLVLALPKPDPENHWTTAAWASAVTCRCSASCWRFSAAARWRAALPLAAFLPDGLVPVCGALTEWMVPHHHLRHRVREEIHQRSNDNGPRLAAIPAGNCDRGHRMATESLTNVVQSLTPQEQDAVLRFIDYLRGRDVSRGSGSPFLQAADEFIAKHPDLLQRLAQ